MCKRLPFFLALILLVGCQDTSREVSKQQEPATQELLSYPLDTRTGADGTLFTELDGSSIGLDFTNVLEPENMVSYLLNGAGICSGDFDNDGLVDLYAVSQDGDNKLFRQVEKWKFKDVTESAGDLQGNDLRGTGATFADVNNDGHLDLYVCNINGSNLLYMNRGDGTFAEMASSWGVDFDGPSTMASFADYDNDGDLDLYLLNNRIYRLDVEHPEIDIATRNGKLAVPPEFIDQYFIINNRASEGGARDVLFENDGNRFVNVTGRSGIGGSDMGLSATWFDFDRDGWVDIYVCNDLKSPDHLYHNNGDGTFTDVLEEAVFKTSWFAMGADVADINNDGWFDFMSADMSSTTHYKQKMQMGEMGNSAWFLVYGKPRQFMRNVCQINTGTGRFVEAGNLLGLGSTDWSWSVKFGDQDCDGREDVYVTNGIGRDVNDSDRNAEYKRLIAAGKRDLAKAQIFDAPPLEERNMFFQNKGNLEFADVSEQWGANYLGVSQGCTSVDIDRDGDLDLIVNNMNESISIFRNDSTSGNRVLFKLRGDKSNANGIHAILEIESAMSGKQIRQLNLTRGYMSSDEPLVHFGLGQDTKIDRLVIDWPSGIRQELKDLAANQLYEIFENGSSQRTPPSPVKTYFRENANQAGIQFEHEELEYDDYQDQPLLPNKLSQLGPGVAVGDVNGDGISDFYVGGGAGQIGGMMIGNTAGQFERVIGKWAEHRDCEDMGALFFDVDSDGDQDLYVVSGGYEFEPGSKKLIDRLYLNRGNGEFEIAEQDRMPQIAASGSCVVAADFDHDNDLDLFVGARMVPKRWPQATGSYLLVNEGGKLVDKTETVAPHLKEIGMVTSAVWSDIDSDGWSDLMIATEWGPVTCLKNQNGKLVDATLDAGLEKDTGWWNSISAGDIDHDGDMDFVALNVGLNTKYHASHDHPVQLFFDDFDGDGNPDIVEAEYEGETCYPIRGRSCSSHAMPFVKEKFETFHEFALADLKDIYTEDAISESDSFQATRLNSIWLKNDGKGQFEIIPLPRIVQVAPGFGVSITDFDSDGYNDVCLVQNFLHPQPETGQLNGGLGVFLKGDGTGKLQAIGPRLSGIIEPNQSMALAVLDSNLDAKPDFVVSVNAMATRFYQNEVSNERVPCSIQLVGGRGNLTAAGATVDLFDGDRLLVAHEISCGSGYLSQSDGKIFCSRPENISLTAKVTWPDGTTQTQSISPEVNIVKIQQEEQLTSN